MEKKLTKKEIEEMNKKQTELRTQRRFVIEAVKNYWEDLEATKRYYKLNEMTDKLNYGGNLFDEDAEKLLRRYECLNFVKLYGQYEKNDVEVRTWDFIRMMIRTDEEYCCYSRRTLDKALETDAIWNDDIIWSTEQVKLYLKLARKFGYTKFYYTNASSGALANITDFINLGAKVIGTCAKAEDREKAGLILDISEINFD